jgi:hypothetical protein
MILRNGRGQKINLGPSHGAYFRASEMEPIGTDVTTSKGQWQMSSLFDKPAKARKGVRRAKIKVGKAE